VFTSRSHIVVTSSSSHTGLGVCVRHFSVVSLPNSLHIK
jgi:hypothetical protein